MKMGSRMRMRRRREGEARKIISGEGGADETCTEAYAIILVLPATELKVTRAPSR